VQRKAGKTQSRGFHGRRAQACQVPLKLTQWMASGAANAPMWLRTLAISSRRRSSVYDSPWEGGERVCNVVSKEQRLK
jgi:hypothetical protein